MATILTSEQIIDIRKEAVSAAAKTLIGMNVVPTYDLAGGQTTHKSRLVEGMVDATIIGPGGDFLNDEESQTWIESDVLKAGKAIEITMEDQEADPTAMARKSRRAGQRIGELVDDMIFNGGASPLVYGMINGAGNTFAGTAWSAVPAAPNTIYTDILAGDDKLIEDNFEGGRRLIVSRNQWKEIRAEDIRAGKNGEPYINTVEATLVGTGNVLMSQTVPDGTAILFEPGEDNFVFVLKKDLTAAGPYEKDNLTERVLLYMQGVPHRYQSKSICTLTGI